MKEIKDIQNIIFVNSFPMVFVDKLKLYLLNLKKYGNKIIPILHNETNRFTISISQINEPDKYFNFCICVFNRLVEKLKMINIKSVCVYPSFTRESVFIPDEDKKKVLGFYGRILPCKGVFLLVKYWEKISKKYRDWKLVITGNYTKFSKEYYNNIIKYINDNKLNDVIQINVMNVYGNEEKKKVFAEMDIFIQLSLYEGLPFTVLESLQYNTPVIHTNVGGIKEIQNDNINILDFKGIYFEKFDNIEYEKVISYNLYEKYFDENYIIFEKLAVIT